MIPEDEIAKRRDLRLGLEIRVRVRISFIISKA
jgi:hypothetical protein